MSTDAGRKRHAVGPSAVVVPVHRGAPSVPGPRAAVSPAAQRAMVVPLRNLPHASTRNETARPGVYKPVQPKMAPPPVYRPNAVVASPKLPQRGAVYPPAQKHADPLAAQRYPAPATAFGTVFSRASEPAPAGNPVTPRAIQRVANTGAGMQPGVIQPLIVFVSDDPRRFKRIEVIKKVFGNHEVKALKLLTKDCLKKPALGFFASIFSSRPKETLIVNGHGNDDELGDLEPEDLFKQLLTAGLNDTDYDKVILVSCDVGRGYDNFATAFRSKVTQTEATSGIKVLAPIGRVSYDIQEKNHSTQPLLKVVDLENSAMYVRADYGGGEERRIVTEGGGGGGFRLVAT